MITILVLGVFLVGTTVCGPANSVTAGTPTLEQKAAVCDDRALLPATQAGSLDVAVAPMRIELRRDLADTGAPLADALAPRSSPTGATPLRL